MKYLVDNDALSEYLKPAPDASVREWMEGNEWLIPVPVIAEIQDGISACNSERLRMELRKRFEGFLSDYAGLVSDWDLETALIWGELSHSAETRRQPQALWDSLIDAMGVRHGAVIVTRNGRDFRHSETFNPWTGSEEPSAEPSA